MDTVYLNNQKVPCIVKEITPEAIKYSLAGEDLITNENGIVMIDGELKSESNISRFQLVNFSDNDFNIAYKYKGTAYNIRINL